MKNRITSAVAVYAILMEHNSHRILVMRRQNTGYQDGIWQVPAGHVEMGELPSEALIREVREEAGIELRPDEIRLSHVSARPKHDETGNRVDLFFTATRRQWNFENKEPHKCSAMAMVYSLDISADTMTPHVFVGIENTLNSVGGREYSEFTLEQMKALSLYGLK